jgi:tetratricopeptide (TPR) repeat protein
MAGDYSNLGQVYRIRGDLEQAEAMYRQALTLFREIGATPQVEEVKELLQVLHVPTSPEKR